MAQIDKANSIKVIAAIAAFDLDRLRDQQKELK